MPRTPSSREDEMAIALAAYLKLTNAFMHSDPLEIFLEKRWERIHEYQKKYSDVHLIIIACALEDALAGNLVPANAPSDASSSKQGT
jgi:hypothetical protein